MKEITFFDIDPNQAKFEYFDGTESFCGIIKIEAINDKIEWDVCPNDWEDVEEAIINKFYEK